MKKTWCQPSIRHSYYAVITGLFVSHCRRWVKHKGLKKLFETGKTSGVNPQHAERLRKIIALLETSENIDDMDLPGLDLHNLKGKRKNTLSVKVSGNWRVTFKFKNGDMLEVDYEDYH